MDLNTMKEIARKYDERIIEYLDLAQNPEPSLLHADDDAMGYTLKTMSISLWTLWHSNNFTHGLHAVVNLGGDADTNAAVACAILGAKYGFDNIPPYYVDNLVNRKILDDIYQNAVDDLAS